MKEKSCYNCENIICKQRKEKEGVDLVLSQCTAWEEKTVEEQNKDLQTRIVELETALKLIKQGIKDRGDCRYWDDEDYAYKCKECDIPVNCPYNIASKALEEAEEAAK